MSPQPANESVRTRMQGQRRTGTEPELALRRELWRRGLRYRVDLKVLGSRRRADIVFVGARVAVFVDGCFWHSCPLHGTNPKNNAEWWSEKLSANVRRDRDTDAALANADWIVVRVWEHERPFSAADRVEATVRRRMPRPSAH